MQLDTAWVSRFNAILDVVRRGVLLAAALFALGILVIVGNTIRLDIENRRDEIEVTKLVGGSDAFVRRPFLYIGVWYGLGGAVIAGLIVLVVLVLAGPSSASRVLRERLRPGGPVGRVFARSAAGPAVGLARASRPPKFARSSRSAPKHLRVDSARRTRPSRSRPWRFARAPVGAGCGRQGGVYIQTVHRDPSRGNGTRRLAL